MDKDLINFSSLTGMYPRNLAIMNFKYARFLHSNCWTPLTFILIGDSNFRYPHWMKGIIPIEEQRYIGCAHITSQYRTKIPGINARCIVIWGIGTVPTGGGTNSL
jgi:hypothetical protein